MIQKKLPIDEIFYNVSFSDKEKNLISNKLVKLEMNKGDILLKANQPVTNQYYVLEGCLRTYFVDFSGKEHTIQFAIKDWWISDYTAYFNGKNAIMYIEVIKEAVLYKFSRETMNELYSNIPGLESFFRCKMEKAFASFQRRIIENLALNAKERYLSFLNAYPNIEKSIKNYHIASYLGITTESLSRIRNEFKKK